MHHRVVFNAQLVHMAQLFVLNVLQECILLLLQHNAHNALLVLFLIQLVAHTVVIALPDRTRMQIPHHARFAQQAHIQIQLAPQAAFNALQDRTQMQTPLHARFVPQDHIKIQQAQVNASVALLEITLPLQVQLIVLNALQACYHSLTIQAVFGVLILKMLVLSIVLFLTYMAVTIGNLRSQP